MPIKMEEIVFFIKGFLLLIFRADHNIFGFYSFDAPPPSL
jgi:hypothetical protein